MNKQRKNNTFQSLTVKNLKFNLKQKVSYFPLFSLFACNSAQVPSSNSGYLAPPPEDGYFTELHPNVFFATQNFSSTLNMPNATEKIRVTGSDRDDTIITGSGPDVIFAEGGDDYISTGAGNDIIYAGSGADTIDGGSGIDTLLYSYSSEGVNVNLETGIGTGGDAEGDIISNIEKLEGSIYSDYFIGNSSNNLFEGTRGADFTDGRGGIDSVSYQLSNAGVTVNLNESYGLGGLAEGDSYENIENIYATQEDDILTGTDENNVFYSFDGDDIVYGLGGNDQILGYPGDDELYGGAGNDIITGNAGADIMDGGADFDYLSYFSSDDYVVINLETGFADNGHATGDQFTNFEAIYGSDFDDQLTGDANSNLILGYIGSDVLDGGAGIDILSYLFSPEGVTIDLSTNSASGGNAEGDVISNFEYIWGSNYDDHLTGDDSDNLIIGYSGEDILIGKDGDDTFEFFQASGYANYVIDGGEGEDTLLFHSEHIGITFLINLSAIDAENIEIIQLDEDNDYILEITGQDVINVTDDDNILYILGGDVSDFEANTGWSVGTDFIQDGIHYQQYTNGDAIVNFEI